MLSNIAHQWRQPLSVISASASGMKLQKEFELNTEESENQSLDRIVESTKHLSQTIDDFRNFFKPDKNRKEFAVKDVYKKTFDLIGAKFLHSDIVFVENIQDIKIHGLESELIQVVMNIFNNARDILMTNDIENKMIFIDTYEKNGRFVHISIKDNAGGIPIEIIEKIFEPYFTTKHQSQGTGIGLYMSREIVVKHMNGKIEVQNVEFDHNNQKHKGAQFTIEFPKS